GAAGNEPFLERARQAALPRRLRAGQRGAAEMKTVGVIGLGIMGSAMSANLAKNGFKVYGYDVLPKARSALKRAGGLPVDSLSGIQSKVVITSLPSAAALHSVCKTLE